MKNTIRNGSASHGSPANCTETTQGRAQYERECAAISIEISARITSQMVKLGLLKTGYQLHRQAIELKTAINKRVLSTKRRASGLQRTPPWVDWEKINKVYAQATAKTIATGVSHHVDHVIPLQGKLVSGLHVHNNLQVLTAFENMSKHNQFDCA